MKKTFEDYIQEIGQAKNEDVVIEILQHLPTAWAGEEREQFLLKAFPVLRGDLARRISELSGTGARRAWEILVWKHPGLTRDGVEAILGKNLEKFIEKNSRAFPGWGTVIEKHATGWQDPWIQALYKDFKSTADVEFLAERAMIVLRQQDTPAAVLEEYALSPLVERYREIGVAALEHPKTTALKARTWTAAWGQREESGRPLDEAVWGLAINGGWSVEKERYPARLRFIPHETLLDLLVAGWLQHNPPRWAVVLGGLGAKRAARVYIDILPYLEMVKVAEGITQSIREAEPGFIRDLGRAAHLALMQSGHKDIVISVVDKIGRAKAAGRVEKGEKPGRRRP